jgi:sortase A
MKTLRVIGCILLLIGAAITARAAYLHAKAELAGMLIRRAWDERLDSGESRPPWPWADTHPIARLRIPRLLYDAIVLEGASSRTLAFGPARIFSGAAPGGSGNLLLAGHRTSWFRSLETISVKDEINLEWFDLNRRELLQRDYSVASIDVVQPDAARRWLAPTSGDALTLITCFPFGASPNSPQRFVVRAAPIGPTHVANAQPQGDKAIAAFWGRYERTAFGHQLN